MNPNITRGHICKQENYEEEHTLKISSKELLELVRKGEVVINNYKTGVMVVKVEN